MPTSNLAAANISGVPYDQWQLTAGATKVAAVAANDGDTTYIRSGTSNNIQCFNVTWPAAGVVGSVNSLIARGYLKYATDASWHAGVGCRNTSGENVSNITMTNAYALYSHTCSRPGGGSFTYADCANGVTWLEVRNYTSPGSGNVPCTMLYFTLDYEVAGAVVFVNFLSVLLPMFGVLAGLSSRGVTAYDQALARAVSRELYRKTGTRFRPDEYAAMLASLRDYRSPRFVFLGQPAML